MISLKDEIRAKKVVEMAHANTLTHSSDIQVEEPVEVKVELPKEPDKDVDDLITKGKASIEKLIRRRSQNEK